VPTLAAVLDACVLYPAVLRDTLLRSSNRGLYHCHWTDRILEEVRRNLVASGRTTEAQAEWLLATIRDKFQDGEVSGYDSLIDAMINDPKDRHVAAAAVACQAQVIVTINLRHFPAQAIEPFGVEAQSPDTFLTHLFHADAPALVDVIDRQAAALRRPPVPVEDILDKLSAFAPEFARLVHTYRAGSPPPPDRQC